MSFLTNFFKLDRFRSILVGRVYIVIPYRFHVTSRRENNVRAAHIPKKKMSTLRIFYNELRRAQRQMPRLPYACGPHTEQCSVGCTVWLHVGKPTKGDRSPPCRTYAALVLPPGLMYLRRAGRIKMMPRV